jgi:uncharacterized coiled-coil protein SlyX
MTDLERIEILEKKIAVLEKTVQEQPKMIINHIADAIPPTAEED